MDRIVLFDGVCNYCNAMVNFSLIRDSRKLLKFAPLQSEIGQQLLIEHNVDKEIDSVVFIDGDQAHLHSTAALMIAKYLSFPWSLSYALIVVPRPIRDVAYRAFAKYRYSLFGRTDACMVPTPDVRERFIS